VTSANGEPTGAVVVFAVVFGILGIEQLRSALSSRLPDRGGGEAGADER